MVRLLQLCIGMFMLQHPSPAKNLLFRTAVLRYKDCSPYIEGLKSEYRRSGLRVRCLVQGNILDIILRLLHPGRAILGALYAWP